jgi:hypothetical protein
MFQTVSGAEKWVPAFAGMTIQNKNRLELKAP